MAIFMFTKEDTQHFDHFTTQTSQIIEKLTIGGAAADTAELTRFSKRFTSKINDFFNAERRLNIGIVGQVKAGKSSFLNTLLFNGRPVLPKASTPKTATLTKIEYAEENAMEIEYYSAEDWEAITDNAKSNLDGMEYESARELVKMANESGIDITTKITTGKERIAFASYDELMNRLNDYVGENGRYTALVKAVILYVNNPLFQELSIVDTPGLNDPIVSRTLRTKEFIEVCDVVFFLTPCSAFLDQSDWTLLSTQLPQKGVKRLTLVGSKFDSGLRDVLRKSDPDDPFGEDPNTADTIPAASALVRKKLTARAQQKINEYEKRLRQRDADETLIRVLNQCRNPVFVSAIAQNMTGRDTTSFDSEESNVYHALSEFSSNLAAELPTIGNFAAVKAIQQEVVSEKETILKEKYAEFVPTAREELVGLLSGFQDKARGRLALLSGSDRQQLLVLKNDIQKRINSIRTDIRTATGEWMAQVEAEKAAGVRALRNAAKENQKLDERSATETETGSRRVSDSKWYNPFSWGKYHLEYYSYDVSYTYIAASDAVDNIRRFVLDSESQIEKTFLDAVNQQQMKRRLLNIVATNFDMGDERYDAALFRVLVEDQINKIAFPVIRVDCGSEVDAIATRFSGQLKGSDKDALRTALAKAIDNAFSAMTTHFEQAAAAFKTSLSNIGEELQDTLLQDMNTEFDEILKDLDEKDENIRRLTAYVKQLDEVLQEVRR